MTAFFVPGAPREQADQAYEDLRDRAELDVGRAPRAVRIYKLSCRRGGTDCETCVGEHDISGETVHAIFDFGEMGRSSLRLLLELMQETGQPPQRVTIAPELVVRRSTAPPLKR